MISRIIFLLVFTAGGYMLGVKEGLTYEGAIGGAGIGIVGLIVEFLFSRTGTGSIFAGLIGMSMGFVFA